MASKAELKAAVAAADAALAAAAGKVRMLDETVVEAIADEVQPRAYTAQEVATMTGLSVQTVRRSINSGELGSFKLGPQIIRVHRDDLDEWWTARSGRPFFREGV